MRTTNERRVCKQLLEAILFERIEPFIEHRRQGQTTFRFVRPPYELTVDGRRGAFDRVWLDIETVVLTRGNHAQSPTLEHIMDCFQLAEPLRLELRQTVQFADACPTYPEPRTHLSYEQLEQALIEGHPYHPCFKSRIGFSPDDHSRYGPEAGQRFRLRFISVPVSIVHQQRMDGVMEQTFGHETYLRLQEKLSAAVDVPTGYHILPVHPWQWQHVEADVRASGGIDLGEAGPLFQATQSIRTVFRPDAPTVPHIKLPLDLMQTSSRRTFTVPNIVAAPVLSDWLVDRTQKLPVTVLREFASQVVETTDGNLSGRIGCLYRDNVLAAVSPDETVIPLTALALREENETLFLEPWFKSYGRERWLKQFLTVYLEPVFRLLIEEGIAVEAHAQNALLVLKDGWPTRLMLRDFHDSVEFVRSFVRRPEKIPTFDTLHPAFRSTTNLYYEMDQVEALRELVVDTVFVFHLTELSHQLKETHQLDETTFFYWTADILAGLNLPPARLEALQLDTPTVYTESLVARKFNTTQCRHLIRNPLQSQTPKGSETHVIH
ncbi:IucA/IucC family protein [Exiguobacterium sp. s192]|uniref:IucA/IucC family protein n=1 Tax=Exiguobacterium sp. s192 TaxID=2751206 RepID=UPI001BE5189F|nr:IucA/IucC family protein [Exiguobacterium sp. s192]